jgi:hypothetical protein
MFWSNSKFFVALGIFIFGSADGARGMYFVDFCSSISGVFLSLFGAGNFWANVGIKSLLS